MSPRRTTLLALVASLTVLPASAGAAPADTAKPEDPHAKARTALTAKRTDLDRRRVELMRRLERSQAALLVARARRDLARERYDEALRAVNQRLSELYRRPPLSPAGQLLAGDPGAATARLDLAEAVARHDEESVRRLRRSFVAWRSAQYDVTARKAALIDEIERLDVDRALVAARLAKIPAPRPKPDPAALTPVYGPFLPGYVPPATAAPATRGLPSDVVSGRTLPGTLAVDPVTGRPVVVAAPAR